MLLKFLSWLASSAIYIRVLTDHQSLREWYTEDLNAMIGSVGRQGRWHAFLSEFNLIIVYIQGNDQKVSDALSRWAYPACPDSQDITFYGDTLAQRYADLCDEAENVDDNFPNADLRVLSCVPLPSA